MLLLNLLVAYILDAFFKKQEVGHGKVHLERCCHGLFMLWYDIARVDCEGCGLSLCSSLVAVLCLPSRRRKKRRRNERRLKRRSPASNQAPAVVRLQLPFSVLPRGGGGCRFFLVVCDLKPTHAHLRMQGTCICICHLPLSFVSFWCFFFAWSLSKSARPRPLRHLW